MRKIHPIKSLFISLLLICLFYVNLINGECKTLYSINNLVKKDDKSMCSVISEPWYTNDINIQTQIPPIQKNHTILESMNQLETDAHIIYK